MRLINNFLLGSIGNNAYLIETNGKIVLIDAPENVIEIIDYAKKKNLIIDYVFLTHGHYDHILGLDLIVEHFPDIKIVMSKDEKMCLTDINENLSFYTEKPYTYEGEVLTFDDINLDDFGVGIDAERDLGVRNCSGVFEDGDFEKEEREYIFL